MSKNKVYELKFKEAVIKEFLSGTSITRLSIKYNVPKGTISNWTVKNRKSIPLDQDKRGRPKENIDYKERYEILKKFQTFLKEVEQEKK